LWTQYFSALQDGSAIGRSAIDACRWLPVMGGSNALVTMMLGIIIE